MPFTNRTNVQASFCIAGGAGCLGNLPHSPPKNAEASVKPIHTCANVHAYREALIRSKQLSCEFLCSPYWFLTDSPQFHHCIPVQEQLIIILSWALKPETMGEIANATLMFLYTHICCLCHNSFLLPLLCFRNTGDGA